MKDKKKFTQNILRLLGAAGGGFLGYTLAKSGLLFSHTAGHGESALALGISFIPVFFLVIGIHEAGHALAGLKVNFDFKMYVVGPFLWEKEATHWKFKWNKNLNTFGGMVICLPTDGDNLSRRFIAYAAGGPLASLALAAVAYIMYYLIHISAPQSVQWVAHVFMMTAVFSLIICIVTLIPVTAGGFASDGARIIRLLRGGDPARFETLIVKIIATTTSGTRPAQLNINELEEAQALAKRLKAPFGVYIHHYFHQKYFDLNDIDKAEHHLKEYINDADLIPQALRGALWLDASFFYAYARKDLETALKYWQQFTPSAFIPKAQINATEAVLHLLKGEKDLALAKTDAALKEIPAMMDKGAALALQDKLKQL